MSLFARPVNHVEVQPRGGGSHVHNAEPGLQQLQRLPPEGGVRRWWDGPPGPSVVPLILNGGRLTQLHTTNTTGRAWWEACCFSEPSRRTPPKHRRAAGGASAARCLGPQR